HALLRRQGGRADPLMRHGEVLLNPVTREVLRAGMPIKLSGREFAVLHALLSRPGKVWSIAQLQDNLYGWDEEVGSNTVEVYIHALRKKLGSHFIQNIRGVGYVIPREAPTPPAEPAGRSAAP
ncbi:winged helix-turn-helix domain-containing protein, partial [Ralstonia pseudosolanacearum]